MNEKKNIKKNTFNFSIKRVDYVYNGDDDENVILTVHVFKYMDNSLIDVDVQPNYVRVMLKGKPLQLALNDEVKPDTSTAKRSQTTGHLVITMPKARPVIRPKVEKESKVITSNKQERDEKSARTYLEVDETRRGVKSELANIVDHDGSRRKMAELEKKKNSGLVRVRANSPGFQDDPDVPPLE
jgi:protein TilB